MVLEKLAVVAQGPVGIRVARQANGEPPLAAVRNPIMSRPEASVRKIRALLTAARFRWLVGALNARRAGVGRQVSAEAGMPEKIFPVRVGKGNGAALASEQREGETFEGGVVMETRPEAKARHRHRLIRRGRWVIGSDNSWTCF